MPAGLDVGAADIVAATEDGTDGARNAALAVERSEYVEDFLEGADTASVETEDEVVALGDAAPEVATITNDEPTRLLGADSSLPLDDVPAAVEALLRSLVGEGEGPLRYAPPSDIDAGPIEAAATALGYEPAPIDPGLAVLYDALESPATGLGVVVDGTRTIATLAVEGVPVSRSELSRGGDWIDQELASATGNDPDAVAELRANADLEDPSSGALALRYDTLFSNLALAVADEAPAVDVPIPVIVAGTAAPEGADGRLADALADVELPFEVERVVRAEEPEAAAARGALTAARDGSKTVTEAPDADPAASGFASGLADEDAAAATLASAAGGDPAQTELGEAGANAADPAAAGARAGAGADDRRPRFDDDVASLWERLERLEERFGVDDDQPLDEDVADLAEEIAALVELREDVEELSETLEDRESEVEERLDEAAAAERVEEIESRLDALPPIADLVDLADRVDEIDADDVSEIAATLEEQADDVESVRSTADELAEEVETLEDDLDAVEDEVASVDDEIETVDEAVDAVRDDVEELEDARADLDGELDDVRDTIDAEVGDLEDTVEELDAEVEYLADSGADEEAVDALRERVEVVETAVEDAQDAVEDAATADDLDDVETAIEDAEATIEDLEAAHEGMEDRVDDLSTEFDDAEASIEDIEAAHEEVDDRVDDVADRVSDLEGEVPDPDLVDALSVDLEALRGRVEELEDGVEERFQDLADDLDAVESEAADAEELAAVESDVVALEAAVEDAEDEREELDAAVADLESEIGDLESLSGDVEDVQAAVDSLPDDVVGETQHHNDVTRVEARIDEVENRIAETEANADGGAGRPAILVLGLGLAAVGGLGAGLAYLSDQVALAGGFVGVPLVAVVIAWYLS